MGFPRHRPRRDRGGVRDGVRGARDVPDAPPAEHDGRRPPPHTALPGIVVAFLLAHGLKDAGLMGEERFGPILYAMLFAGGRADRRTDGDAVGSGPAVGAGGERGGAGGRLHLAVRRRAVPAAVEGGRRTYRAGRRAVRGGRAGDPRRRLYRRRLRGPAVAGGGGRGTGAERDPRRALLEAAAGQHVRPQFGECGGREPAGE